MKKAIKKALRVPFIKFYFNDLPTTKVRINKLINNSAVMNNIQQCEFNHNSKEYKIFTCEYFGYRGL